MVQLPTRKLGKNGPEVTALGFGLMGLSAYYGKPKPDAERFALLDHAYDAGERFWDSADIYGDNEDMIGRWFKQNPGKRENIFLATKFGNWVDPATGQRKTRNEPEYIQQAVEKSLKRLGVDQIDLYYAHRINSSQPIETTVKEMKKLQDAGKVKYLGLSECSAETLRRACKVRRCSFQGGSAHMLTSPLRPGRHHQRRATGVQPVRHGHRRPADRPATNMS